MKKIFFLLIPALLYNVTGKAQNKNESNNFSLQQAIDYAYLHQKDVLNAQIDEQISIAKVRETIGIGLPQISGSFDMKDYFELNYLFPGVFSGGVPGSFSGFNIKTPSYSAAASVQASQLIFDGTYIVGLQAARTYKEFSQKNLARTKIETAVSVSKAYYNVLVSRERLKLIEANVTRVQKLRDDTKALFDNGFVEKTDYDRVVLTYNNITTEKENVSRLIRLSEYMLKFQVGMDIQSDLVLTDSLNADQLKNLTVNAEKNDITGRIEFSILKTQRRLEELDLKRYRFMFLPNVMLYGNLSTVEQRPKFSVFDSDKKWYPTGFVGASVIVPIFDGLQRSRKIEQSKLTLKKTDNEFAQLANGLSMEAESSRTILLNAIASFKTQEQNLELANEVVRVSKAKYDQGVGSNLEVISAETSLRESQTNYYNALYDALVAKVELDRATGKLK
jgi:outer membrane protein